jgi:uncharacterized protein
LQAFIKKGFARVTLWSLSCCIAFIGAAKAEQKVDLYRLDTLVKSQSVADRNLAAAKTLSELVVRVSGRTDAAVNPLVLSSAKKASNFLASFSYKSTTEKIVEKEKSYPALNLQLTFTSQMIEKLLRDAGLPFWPAQRPSVLVWLVYQDEEGLHRGAAETKHLDALQKQARLRGLPIIMPMLDREDNFALSAKDLWDMDHKKISSASARYNADAILVGRYSPQQNIWKANWQLMDVKNASDVTNTTAYRFSDNKPWVEELLVSAVNATAEYYANRYAIAPSQTGPQTLLLNVKTLSSFAAFKKLQTYLKSLAMVKAVDLVMVNQEEVLMRLTIEGDQQLFVNTLALGRRLLPLDQTTEPELEKTSEIQSEKTNEVQLTYAWQN